METGLFKAKIRNINYKHDRRMNYLQLLIKLEEIEYNDALKRLKAERRFSTEMNKYSRITYSYNPIKCS